MGPSRIFWSGSVVRAWIVLLRMAGEWLVRAYTDCSDLANNTWQDESLNNQMGWCKETSC